MMKHLFLLLTTSITPFLLQSIAQAQTYQPSDRNPTIDNTLNTQISIDGNNFNITGGLTKGKTLFHSFTDFSIQAGRTANFINPEGNRDTIARVTGSNFSDINGLINSNGANFFLINPNGIVFGTNAQLNVGKAFVASTANGIDLVNVAGTAITFSTNLSGDPLLRIAPDIAFDVSRFNLGGGTGEIRNFGKLENYNPNPYIGLIGGNITFDGQNGEGRVIAPGGRVDLGGLNTAGNVTTDNRGLVFDGSGVRSDVSMLNGANVYVLTNESLGTVNTFVNNATSPKSSINIYVNNLRMINDKSIPNTDKSYLTAGLNSGSGINTVTTGDINIDAKGEVSLNNARIASTVESDANGNVGNIIVNSKSLSLNNGSQILSAVLEGGTGNVGDIRIKTEGDISVVGINDTTLLTRSTPSSQIINSIFGTGTAGKITIDTKGDLFVSNSGGIINSIHQSGVGLKNNRQGIKIDARNLSVKNSSGIEARNYGGSGNAGNIDIKLKGDLSIVGNNNPAGFPNATIQESQGGINSATEGIGNAGNININAKNVSLQNFGLIQANNYQNNLGDGGNIKIVTTGDLTISGTTEPSLLIGKETEFLSSIGSANAGKGKAGGITIETKGKLSIVNRGGIYNSIDKTGDGEGQDIKIEADRVSLINFSSISSANYGGKGKSGNINIASNSAVELANNSSISNSNFGQGESANILVTSDRIDLNNSSISAVTETDKGGNITLSPRDRLLLRNNSKISTDANSFGRNSNGGNISINSPLIVAAPGNNDITANAYEGNGGKVNIVSQGLFGIDKRAQGSDLTNDITASSGFGNSGIVDIKTPGVDPGKDSTELPNVPTDASNQISQACSASNRDHKLTVTGRGGLPPNANDPLTSDVVWQDARAASSQPAISSATTHPAKLAPPAVGWIFNGQGKVTLVAATTPGQPTQTTVVCPNLVKK